MQCNLLSVIEDLASLPQRSLAMLDSDRFHEAGKSLAGFDIHHNGPLLYLRRFLFFIPSSFRLEPGGVLGLIILNLVQTAETRHHCFHSIISLCRQKHLSIIKSEDSQGDMKKLIDEVE